MENKYCTAPISWQFQRMSKDDHYETIYDGNMTPLQVFGVSAGMLFLLLEIRRGKQFQ